MDDDDVIYGKSASGLKMHHSLDDTDDDDDDDRVHATDSAQEHGADPESGGGRVRTMDFDTKKENHYVIVIHGTFDAPPTDGTKTWYQPPNPGEQNFCSKLAALLDEGPIGGDAVWKDFPGEVPPGVPYPFNWDGTNTNQGRVNAATRLHRLIAMLGERDPGARVHLVAHSHGGNVMLKTVELLMKLLEKRYRTKAWNPQIKKQFWAAYQRSYDMIGQWRQMEPPRNKLLCYFPFLIVWRNMSGGKSASTEKYPWGYYPWWDRVLGLGSIRRRRLLANRIVTSPITNPLGALVFLGTPFYVKKWEDMGFLYAIVTLLVTAAVAFVMIGIYIYIWKLIVLAIAGQYNGFFSNDAVTFSITGALTFLVLVSLSIQLSHHTVFHSGNLYHHPQYAWSPAMSALVIHAGKLDEASLALSTEPIVRAYVFPHLTKILQQTPFQPLPQRPAPYAPRRIWFGYGFNFFMAILWNIVFFLPAAFMAAISWIIAPAVTDTIQKAVVSVSFGLEQGELNFAYIYVDEHLEMPHSTQTVEHWNVQKLLAEAKTRSLQGELMPGYEDDTVDTPAFLEPVEEPEVDLTHNIHGSASQPMLSGAGPGSDTGSVVGLEGRAALTRTYTRAATFRRRGGMKREFNRHHTFLRRDSEVESNSAAPSGPNSLSEVPYKGELKGPAAAAAAVAAIAAEKEKFAAATAAASAGGGGGDSAAGPGSVENGAADAPIKKVLRIDTDSPREINTPTRKVQWGDEGTRYGSSKLVRILTDSPTGQERSKMVGGVPVASAEPAAAEQEKLVYDFLWDDDEMEKAVQESGMFNLLKDQMDKIDHNPRLTKKEFERQLKALCLMFEARLGELTGKLDLNHGSYFRDPRILKVIAHYIAHRQLPEWSKQIDTDMSRLDQELDHIFLPSPRTGTLRSKSFKRSGPVL